MKRTWEVMFGRYLDLKGWAWRYEPRPYLLPSGRRYIPDFEVKCRYGKVFFDVKGWKKPDSMAKIKQFSGMHTIVVVDGAELLQLTGMKPERFKTLYDARDPWAYRGQGPAPWKLRRIPTGLR